ncbi:IQ motif and ubiquitin-like domain-containing protein [Lycorma delicatula]|uniref:IQ motif and ubiquitin-like domain-containing protein n=1 Tax=Lycorma delicatula TaxID=130591 RepID=UPI003F50E768
MENGQDIEMSEEEKSEEIFRYEEDYNLYNEDDKIEGNLITEDNNIEESATIHDLLEEIPSERVVKTILFNTSYKVGEEEEEEEEDIHDELVTEEALNELVNKEESSESVENEGYEDELPEGETTCCLTVPCKQAMPTPESMTDEESEDILSKCSDKTEIKERLASIFKLNVGDIRLNYENNECDDLLPLSGLGVEPLGTIELGIQSTDPTKILAPGQFRHYIPVVDVITVRIPKDEGGFKDIIVEIEDQNFVKKWLGGYRHRITKIEYYHAMTQTKPKQRNPELPPLFSRITQTPVFPLKDATITTTQSKMTQMWRRDHYISSETDKIITTDPNRFKGNNLYEQMDFVTIMVRRLQRFCKGILAKKKERLAEELRKEKQENERKAQEIINRTAQEGDKRLIFGTTFPINRGDFYLLYLMVGKWWRNEIEKIKKMKHNESRKAAYLDLLKKEITFLSVIDKQRSQVKKEILRKHEMDFISYTARPKIFCNNKGTLSSIDTLETQQARELQEILSSYLNTNVTIEQRLDMLNNLKNLINNYKFYEYSDEIISLLNRECDLLSVGMKAKQLVGLRERVEQLLFYYAHKYQINPSSKNYKKPQFPKTDSTLYQCTRCKKLKPACDFNVHIRMTAFIICHSCEWIKNIGHERIDLTPYFRLLRQVRITEMKNCCNSSIAFVFQGVGMYYLAHHIWNDQSAISGKTNIYNLCSVRFRKNIDWSPWNCIFLTLQECNIHLSIDNIDEFYDKHFLEKIKWNHERARNVFQSLMLNDIKMNKSKLWFKVQDSGKFLHKSHVRKFAQQDDFEYIS